MKIVVWNLKGGQGKTVLSIAIAMLENFYVVTNDVHSPIDDVIGEDRALRMGMRDPLPEVPEGINLIYDFGGYPDARIIDAAKQADVVIVPIIYESPLEMQVTLNALGEIEKYNDKIVIVLNKAKAGDFERAKAVFEQFDIHYPVFEVKQSTAFSRAIEHKKSLQQMVDESPLFSFHYSKPLEQVRNLIKAIS
jgi:MinD superfamily P-loop ATPase